jgi:alkylhydroperoxidase family enzyme
MARIAGLEKNEAPWHLRWFYNMTRKMFGKDLTPAKIQMKVPAIFWGAIGMEAALSKKRRVSLRLTQLAKVRTAYRIGCPFWVDINSAVGRKAGLTDQKLLAVTRNDFSVFNDKELLVIELADAMVTAPANIDDDLYARLRDAFSEEQLLELTAQIAFENYRARSNRVFDVESDHLYAPESAAVEQAGSLASRSNP